MLRRLFDRLTYANVVASLALFVALGGSAYAVNTVRSTDIVDGEVKSVDIGNGEVGSNDIKDNSVNTFDVHSFLGADVVDGSLTGDDVAGDSLTGGDIQNRSLGASDLALDTVTGFELDESTLLFNNALDSDDIGVGAVGSSEVADGSLGGSDIGDNSLTGNDINEATLAMPPTTTAGFAFGGPTRVFGPTTFQKVASKVVPAGIYAVVATATLDVFPGGDGVIYSSATCELRTTGFIGGTTDRRTRSGGQRVVRSLTMNGIAELPAGGGEVSVWCNTTEFAEDVSSQMLFIRADARF